MGILAYKCIQVMYIIREITNSYFLVAGKIHEGCSFGGWGMRERHVELQYITLASAECGVTVTSRMPSL